MNAIPAFITSLSVLHNNISVELCVQCVNEIFWGATLEQCRLQQSFSTLIPTLLLPFAQQPWAYEGDDEDMPLLF